MKKSLKYLMLILTLNLAGCYGTDDDSNKTCVENCNTFSGKIYRDDGVGIEDVEITLSYTINQIGMNYTRVIAKSKTDSNGDYVIEAFIKDGEFGAGVFRLTVDKSKIESSLPNDFYKPSDLLNEVAPRIDEHLFSDLENREQIKIVDYRIPRKTSFVVHLNDFYPNTANDKFGVGNRIEYGFPTGGLGFFTEQSQSQGYAYADAINSTLTIPGVIGENYVKIYRFKNGLVENTSETLLIDDPNAVGSLNYSF